LFLAHSGWVVTQNNQIHILHGQLVNAKINNQVALAIEICDKIINILDVNFLDSFYYRKEKAKLIGISSGDFSKLIQVLTLEFYSNSTSLPLIKIETLMNLAHAKSMYLGMHEEALKLLIQAEKIVEDIGEEMIGFSTSSADIQLATINRIKSLSDMIRKRIDIDFDPKKKSW
jgi:hypothetical protein